MKVKVTNAGLVPPNPLPIPPHQPIVSNNAVNQVAKSTNIEKSNTNLGNITTAVSGQHRHQQLIRDTNNGGLLQGVPTIDLTEEDKTNTGLTASSLVLGKAITSASLVAQPKTNTKKVYGVKLAAKPDQKSFTEPVIIHSSCTISNNSVTALNNAGNGNAINKQPNKRKIKAATSSMPKVKVQKIPSTQSHLVPATIAVSSTSNFVPRNSTISTSLSSFTATTNASGFTVRHQPTASALQSQDLFSVPVSTSDVLNLPLTPQLTSVFSKASTQTTSSGVDQVPRVSALSNNKLLPNAGHAGGETDTAPNTCVTQKSSTSLPSSQVQRRSIHIPAAAASRCGFGNNKVVFVAEKGPLISLRQDIVSMLYGFGGIKNPDEKAITLVEGIIRLELQGFVFLCERAATIRQSKGFGFYEAIFVLRREKFRLHKLFKYFEEKDVHEKFLLDNKSGQNTELHMYMKEIRTVVEDLDSAGELIRVLENEDSEVLGELKNQEDLSRRNLFAASQRFYKFMTALGMSLSKKLTNMQKWCSQKLFSSVTFSPLFIEILSFLTYEIVAHIVELTIIISWERERFCRSIRSIGFPGINPDTCMSEASYQRKRKDEDCKNVSEILVQASEMEAKRLKTADTTIEDPKTETTPAENAPCVRPDLRVEDVAEAYRRIQDCTVVPCLSYRARGRNLGR